MFTLIYSECKLNFFRVFMCYIFCILLGLFITMYYLFRGLPVVFSLGKTHYKNCFQGLFLSVLGLKTRPVLYTLEWYSLPCSLLHLWNRVSCFPRSQPETVLLLPTSPGCWDSRHVPQCQGYLLKWESCLLFISVCLEPWSSCLHLLHILDCRHELLHQVFKKIF
jgi:hypothetical protein